MTFEIAVGVALGILVAEVASVVFAAVVWRRVREWLMREEG